jgi:ribosome-binding protein aMBF1 (putative translation factor)
VSRPANILGRRVGRPCEKELHGKARRYDQRCEDGYRVAIATLVRNARLEEGVSVAELAAAIGAHQASIHKIERGVIRPTAQKLCRIAFALGRSPSELMPL